jgi:hypothetical protein
MPEGFVDWQDSSLLFRPPDHTGQSEYTKARIRRSTATEVHTGAYHFLCAKFIGKGLRPLAAGMLLRQFFHCY